VDVRYSLTTSTSMVLFIINLLRCSLNARTSTGHPASGWNTRSINGQAISYQRHTKHPGSQPPKFYEDMIAYQPFDDS